MRVGKYRLDWIRLTIWLLGKDIVRNILALPSAELHVVDVDPELLLPWQTRLWVQQSEMRTVGVRIAD